VEKVGEVEGVGGDHVQEEIYMFKKKEQVLNLLKHLIYNLLREENSKSKASVLQFNFLNIVVV